MTIHQVDRSPHTRLDLTGADTEPVYKVVEDGTLLYTGCRDGTVRKYSMASLKGVVVA